MSAAVLAGCAVPPVERRETPQLELPVPAAVVPQMPAEWWKSFDDRRLDALVAEALANNRDLARAISRIDESRAVLRLASADRLPRVDANVSGSRQHFGENAPLTIGGNRLTFNDFRANLSVAYEVDLWSRAASLSAAAREELLASEFARDTLRIVLAAQVVQSYATLQSLDAQLLLFGEAVLAQRDSLRLQRMRFNAGDISELDVQQLEAELIDNEAQLPKLERARGEAERALALVLGRSPKDLLERGLVRSEAPTLRASGVPAGLPSDLLLRRPDVQAAEARLRAAGARVDAARAAYFPGITLTAAYGFQSTELSNLFDGRSLAWSILAALTQPIWDGGRIDAQYEITQARHRQLELDYRDRVAVAFQETRDALGAFAEASATLRSAQRRAQALARAAELTRTRYDGGQSSRLDVINADRLALTAQAQGADAARALTEAQANVFRVLGGGWHVSSLH
nr:efflux transporter outer membrane subunit [Ramlibacter monticola]